MIEPLTDFRRAVISGIEESAVLQISIAAVAHFPKDQLWLSVYQGKERNLVCAILPRGAYRQFRHTIAVEVLYCIADHIRRFVSPTLPHFLGGYEEVLFTDSISIGESVRVHRQGTKPLNQLVISRIGGGRNTDGLEITVHKGSARPCIRVCVHICIVLRIFLRIDFRYLLRSRGIGCGRLLRILCLTAGRQHGQQQER